MLLILKTVQIFIAVLLVFLVLIQTKNSGLSSGLKNSFTAYRSLRGAEKIIFILTVALGIGIVVNSLLIIKFS